MEDDFGKSGKMEVAAGVVLGLVLFFWLLLVLRRYRRVGPNEAMIISGLTRNGTPRVVTGGGVFVLPALQKVDVLKLEVISVEVCTPEVYSERDVPIVIRGIAHVKVHSTDDAIRTAAEHFLQGSRNEIMKVTQHILEGHMLAVLGQMVVEDIYKNRDLFAEKVVEASTLDFAKMGLELVSFTLLDIKDRDGLLDALGRPRLSPVKRDEAGKNSG